LAEVAQNEKEQFVRILGEQRAAEEKEKRIQDAKKQAQYRHLHSLQDQIHSKTE
jgi:hypothetical protein